MKKSDEKKRLVLLDAHAIIHRAYHALPEFSNAEGEPTGALYGLSSMLISIISELKPDYIVACFDLPKPTHRHEAYKEYKAGRQKADTELIAQIIRSREVFEAFNIPIYEKEGFEADDILGTIVEIFKDEKDFEIVIASGDMDTLQLVSGEKVRVYTLKKGIKDTIVYDEKSVNERFGFGPELLPDYKGLRGDPSDNIIGIKGIGEKTATTLIKEFGTIENLYKKLKAKDFKVIVPGISPRILELIKNGEEEALFSKVLATIRRDAPISFELPKEEWAKSLSLEKADALFTELEFRTLGARLRQSLGIAQGKTEDEKSEDTEKKEDIDKNDLEETSIALWLVTSNITDPKTEDILNFAKTKDFKEAKDIIFKELEKRNLLRVWNEIEKPLIPIVKRIQDFGIRIDVTYLENLGREYHAMLDSIEKNIWRLAGKEFNVASPKQLGEVLFTDLGLKASRQKKTAGGALSTKESELEKLRDTHPIIDEVLKYREYSKLLGTYIDTIPKLVDKNSRLHTRFIQAGTTTGRLSSENPNLQNIPNKTDTGRAIRKAFVADGGWKLLAIDYSQMELRIAAFMSKDPALMEIFREGQDVHTAVASRIFGVPIDEVTKAMRRHAKVINFGIIYGMGVLALKQNLGTSREEAQKFYNDYFKTFNVLASYLDGIKASAARKGFVETFFGRRRYFEGINSHLPYIKAAAERMAINAPIQGTEADIVKRAMIDVDSWIEESGNRDNARILLNVHDELVFEVKAGMEKKFAEKFVDIMESVVSKEESLGIPIIADARVGNNWEEMEGII